MAKRKKQQIKKDDDKNLTLEKIVLATAIANLMKPVVEIILKLFD